MSTETINMKDDLKIQVIDLRKQEVGKKDDSNNNKGKDK